MIKLTRYIKIQLKIFQRFLNLFFSGVVAYIVIVVFIIATSEFRAITNIPFFIVVICCFVIGPFLGEIFCGGENEKRSYCLAPWSLRSVIISKSTAMIIVLLVVPIPLLIINSFFVRVHIPDLTNASLYLLTAIPVFLIIGNLISVLVINKNTGESSSRIFYQFLMFIISFLPYILFSIWLQSMVLCIIFFVISLMGWYLYIVPLAVNKFLKQNFNLQEI